MNDESDNKCYLSFKRKSMFLSKIIKTRKTYHSGQLPLIIMTKT